MTENNRTTEIGLNGQLNDVVNEMQTMQKSLEMFQSNMVQRLKIFRKVTEDYFRDSTGRLSVINQFFDLSLDKPEKRADKHPHTFKTGLDAIGNRLEDLSKQIDSHYVTINKRLDTLDQRFVTLEKDVGFMKQRFHTIGGHLEGLDSRFNNLGVRLDSQFSNMEENLDALESPFDAIEKRFNLLDERFDDIEQSLDDLDPRFASLEQNYTAIDPKLESLGHRLDSVTRFDALRQPLADIKQCFHPLVQHNDNFKLHFDSSIQSIHKNIDQRSCVSEQCSNAINGIAVDIVREVQGLKIEIRAGHFNAGARVFNSSSTRSNSTIYAPLGIDGAQILSFPATYAHLRRLRGGDLDEFLRRLALPNAGNDTEKRNHLCTYVGVPRMSTSRWLRA